MTVLNLRAGKVNPIVTRFRIISSGLSSVSAVSLFASTGLGERTLGYTRSRNAHMWIFPMTVYRVSVGQKHLMHCCLRRFGCFAVDMSPMIFTLAFPQKEKSIATESGLHRCCRHSNIGESGMSRVRLISIFLEWQTNALPAISIILGSP